jgi:hypothetical protein
LSIGKEWQCKFQNSKFKIAGWMKDSNASFKDIKYGGELKGVALALSAF